MVMKTNMSITDRTIRIVIAALVLLLYFFNFISGTLALVLMIIGAILAVTAIIGFCPIYALFRINTLMPHKKTS